MNLDKVWLYLTAIVLAGLGGVLKTITHSTRANCSQWCIVSAGATSAFIGLLSALTMSHYGVDIELIGAVSGAIGWLGADFVMGLFVKKLKEKLK